MQRSDFNFDLPESLIAQQPLAERSASRMLVLDGVTGNCQDYYFKDLLDFVQAGDLLVFNDTRVIPARVFGKKETGGQLEMLVERVTGEHTCKAHLRSSKSPKAGTKLIFDGGYIAHVEGRDGALFKLRFEQAILDVLHDVGHMPLPPYIEREDTEDDQTRYQTVFSDKAKTGAVAAPTAGLHFDDAMLERLRDKGVEFAYVTLHVGAGTFQPMRADDLQDHVMHSEWVDVPEKVVHQVTAAKQRGGKVVAVGTTAVRSLESAVQFGEQPGVFAPFTGDTQLFIYPGYDYQVVDAIFTNFHLPESTLIMLVSAFAGYEHTMHAYQHAIDQQYRFFSYGDAMLITQRNPA